MSEPAAALSKSRSAASRRALADGRAAAVVRGIGSGPGDERRAGAVAQVSAAVLRAAPERDYGPFVYVDDARPASPACRSRCCELVQRAHRRRAELAAGAAAGRAARARAKRREADLLTSLRPEPPNAPPYLLFTAGLRQGARRSSSHARTGQESDA
ncbi:MAG: hypothetical protein MZW92_28205 [Comamonadaceae bacterium]|nr:hypothetical protein [Comamonadaceae bacterium]